jgi:hypothetical protein
VLAGARINSVVFDAPYAGSLDRFGEAARAIAAMYAELLGQEHVSRAEMHRRANWPFDEGDEVDQLVLAGEPHQLGIAFELQSEGYEPPRWPDPAYPQQMHVDLFVPDLDAAEALALRHGATKLRDGDGFRTYADAVGHPFCLYPDTGRSRIGRIVIDCPDPPSLSAFYEELLGTEPVPTALAFQRSDSPPPRWPDPRYPEQVHLDLGFDDAAAARERAVRLGATVLRETEYHHVLADPAGHPFCI